MNLAKSLLHSVLFLTLTASVVAPTGATTLIRESLDDLVAGNRAVIVGEVVDAHSYWNADHTFILTDVQVAVRETLKGTVANREVTLTILGGRVGELTAVIVGGPELIPGNSYLLFLNEENLPGVRHVLTVRDLCQGTFDIKLGRDGLRAVSQANRHLLVRDPLGRIDAAGGAEGMPLAVLMQSIHETVLRQRTLKGVH